MDGANADVKVRDWFLLRLEDRLDRLTVKLQPITAAEFEKYLDPATYGIWLDRRRIDNAQLNDYPRTEIYRLYKPSRLYKNARHYGEYTYQLELVTKQEVAKKVRKLREDIAYLKQE